MHQNSLAASQNAGGGDVQPLKLVHRSLRGRYKIAALLAAVGAAVGMAVGWTSFEKTFRAKGYVRISPEIISLAGQKEVQSDYTRYMGSEAVTLRTSEIASNAMANAIWVKAVDGTPWEPAQFASRVQARFEGSTNDIVVSFDHPNRDVAVAGMRSVLAAYEDYRATQRREQIDVSAKYLEQQKREIQASIESSKSKIAQIKRDDAKGNIDERALNKGKRLAEYQNRLDDERFTLERMEAVKAAAMAKPTRIDEAVLARREPFFARLLVERDNLSIELARLQQVQGPNSPPVQKSRTQLATITGQISAIAEQLSKGSYGVIQRLDNSQAAIEVTDFELANRADTVALLKKQVEAQEADLAVVDSARFEITELTNQIDSKMTELEDLNGKLAIAQAKSLTVNAPFRTFPDPVAAIAEDKRPTMATFGFVVGAGLPLMGLVLFGLMDRKYRYSDEATASGGTRGVALLGILPNLPDRLSDPSQASVAAHCVHQIRTMLQLNCLDDGPSVLAVTSATSGDGKTSLSLALGLSFAASGSRTLLIDTDLIGAGLSARLGIREPSGISEAIVDRNPMQYVRDTDVTDLSVLPVGIEGAQNASAFSPTAVRRLLAELRKHFDLVLIDTGPVLGSIEATPIVAASDAVILTVARGQNRDLVEKAINHLRAVGARIAGVVFNRANARDFERSISGISLRSVSRASANGTNGQSSRNGKHQDGRLGPLVHSVRGTREDVA
jgi:capsular exopolysaccharide synthesis family protein